MTMNPNNLVGQSSFKQTLTNGFGQPTAPGFPQTLLTGKKETPAAFTGKKHNEIFKNNS